MPKGATTRLCELCSEPAALYCPSDSAYLCRNCDSAVHSANFLVARHLRSALCTWCGEFDGEHFSGAGNRRSGSSDCESCGRTSLTGETDVEDDDVSSLSSACISTNESSTAGSATVKCSRDQDCCGEVSSVMRRREDRKGARRCAVDARVEGVLVNWCKRLGLNNQDDVVVATAARVLGVTTSLGRSTFAPVRVALAASFWLGLRFCGDTCRDLKRVEKITRVSAKMILALEAKLERVLKTRGKIASHDDSREGWAEC